jgi:hypothetical protein
MESAEGVMLSGKKTDEAPFEQNSTTERQLKREGASMIPSPN